jgi:hypothetical protein
MIPLLAREQAVQFNNAFIPIWRLLVHAVCQVANGFANLHPLKLAAETTKRALAERSIEPATFDALFLRHDGACQGIVLRRAVVAALIGAANITGPHFASCATSARDRQRGLRLNGCRRGPSNLVCDGRSRQAARTDLPNPTGPGGKPDTKVVWDNFNRDPWAGRL